MLECHFVLKNNILAENRLTSLESEPARETTEVELGILILKTDVNR